MTAQSYQFFIHTNLICKEGNLCQKPRLINLCILQKLLHLFTQLFLVFCDNLRRTFRNIIHMCKHAIQLGKQIIFQIFSL